MVQWREHLPQSLTKFYPWQSHSERGGMTPAKCSLTPTHMQRVPLISHKINKTNVIFKSKLKFYELATILKKPQVLDFHPACALL